MKEVQVVAWCDGEHEPQVPAAVERTETLNGSDTVVLDLCEPCDALFEKDLDTVRAWLARGTVPPKQPTRAKPGPKPRGPGVGGRPPRPELRSVIYRTCPDCGYECPTRSALGQHVKTKHAKTLMDYDWPDNA